MVLFKFELLHQKFPARLMLMLNCFPFNILDHLVRLIYDITLTVAQILG